MNQTSRSLSPVDVGLFVASIIALGVSLLGATGMLVLAIMAIALGDPAEAIAPLAAGASLIVMGLCSLPLLYSSLRGIFGYHPTPAWRPSSAWSLILLLFPLGILLGLLAFENQILPWLFGPLAHTLAAVGPVGAAVVMVIQRGPLSSPRRNWGQFNTGLWISPILAFTLEIILILPVVILILTDQFGTIDLSPIVNSLQTSDSLTSSEMELLVFEFLSQPIVIGSALLYMVILVPVVEEVMKTVAVWPFLGRGLTNAEAFMGGAIAGAGYALFEAFFLAQPGQDWGITMIASAGATLIHMFTAGLTSIGLARAARERTFLRVVPYYALAVGIHGLWNFCALAIGAGVLIGDIATIDASSSDVLITTAVVILITLCVISYLGLRRFPLPSQDVPPVSTADT